MTERAGVGFIQPEPVLGNMYLDDDLLRSLLRAHFFEDYHDNGRSAPSNKSRNNAKKTADEALGRLWSTADGLLSDYAERLIAECYPRMDGMERNRPRIVQFSSFGRRLNRLETCGEWRAMHRHSAENSLIATAYVERAKYGRRARLVQFAKLHLFSPNSGMYGCPLAMTDGAAKLMEILKDDSGLDKLVRSTSRAVFERLTSVNPDTFWTSGQWMTERGGGSDVSDGTRTVATLLKDGPYHELSGYKWFSSASDADVAVTLARDKLTDGKESKRLSCYIVKLPKSPERALPNVLKDLRSEHGTIHMVRLKDKLGTRQLPTAELELRRAKALRVSRPGRGVNFVANLVNITRLHNCVAATGLMSRGLLLARDYAKKRKVFKQQLSKIPLHLETLASLRCLYSACLHITFKCASLQGFVETHNVSDAKVNGRAEQLLRLLTPVAKSYTAKCGVYVLTESMECIGGVGYMEDSGFPRMVRDCMVLPIWEGTTNVLAMDVIRVVRKNLNILDIFAEEIRSMINCRHKSDIKRASRDAIRDCLLSKLSQIPGITTRILEAKNALRWSRDFTLFIAKIFCGASLLRHAEWSGKELDWYIAEIYVLRNPQDNGTGGVQAANLNEKLSLGSYYSDERLLRLLALGTAEVTSKL